MKKSFKNMASDRFYIDFDGFPAGKTEYSLTFGGKLEQNW